MKDDIIELVEGFAKRTSGDKQLTVYHLLFGYARLLTMNPATLNAMLKDKESEDKIDKLIKLADSRELDLRLVKLAFPTLLGRLTDEQSKRTLESLKEEKEECSDSLVLFEKILDINLPEMNLVKKGQMLSDALDYIETQSVLSKKKEREAKEKSVEESKEETGKETVDQQIENRPEDSNDYRRDFLDLIVRSKQLYASLISKVKGQDEAIRVFVQGYFQSEVLKASEKNKKPAATFLFAGPPGVGKTFLAESVAQILDLPYQRFDMSEYSDPGGVPMFAGSPSAFKGSKNGLVTSFVVQHPKCVLLFDEIEKAHKSVIYLFLQILDGGVLKDTYTEKSVSFREAIILFTTNAGRQLYVNQRDTDLSSLPKSVILDALRTEEGEYGRKLFPEAICSRFASGNVVMFNHLSVHHLAEIVQDRFGQVADMVKEQYDYSLMIDPRLALVYLLNQSGWTDARTVSTQSVNMMKNELYELARNLPDPQTSLSTLESISMTMDMPSDIQEVNNLFTSDEKLSVLMFAEEDVCLSNENDQFSYDRTVHMDTAKQLLKEKDYAFVLIDLFAGDNDTLESTLSLDDYRTTGVLFFEWMREYLTEVPIYILQRPGITTEAKSTFLQHGARGFVIGDTADILSRSIACLAANAFLQQKADDLAGRGKILSYDTLQKISEDGRKAEIRFYDFKIKSAVRIDAREMMLADKEKPTEAFADVIGADSAKQELQYFVNYLKNPKKYMIDGVRIPKGILLYGPPGTGKTMLARAMAGEANVSFFSTTAAGFQDKYVGEGERKIRELFSMAKSYAPSIIFIDEIDAIGKERTGSTSTNHLETLLNTLLTEMDGFEVNQRKPVFVLAATNYDLDGMTSGKQSVIDPALLRRFDNKIYVDLPNESERKLYLCKMMDKRGIAGVSDKVLDNIAKRTTGESLAILQNIFELAVRNAVRQGKNLDDQILLNAFEEYNYGEKHDWNENYYNEVAIHESGHALVNWLSGGKPAFVTIVSRGNFGGYMQPDHQEKTPNYSKEDLLWKIRTCLAGRAAEIVFFGEEKGINTGVSSDLKKATDYAMKMLTRYGMGNNSLLCFDSNSILNTKWGQEVLNEADELLRNELSYTISLITENKSRVRNLADLLLDKNHAMTEDILKIFEAE